MLRSDRRGEERLARRRFLALAAGAGAAFGAVRVRPARAAQEDGPPPLADIPRAETLVVAGSGGAALYALPDGDHANVFRVDGSVSRSGPHLAFESLLVADPTTGEPQPWLAERWQVSDDGLELTFALREDVRWSDGRPFTAADPAFTLTMLRDAPAAVAFAADLGRWLDDAVAVDARTLRLRLVEPNRRFLTDLLCAHPDGGVPIVPARVWEGVDPVTFRNLDLERGWPVVTGPYRLVRSDSGARLWDRRDDWWAAAAGLAALPAPRRLVFWAALEPTRLAQSIAVDAADVTAPIPSATIEALLNEHPAASTPTGRTPPYGVADPWPIVLGFNCSTPPFDDRLVRRAVGLSIDRAALIAAVERGDGSSAETPFPDTPPVAAILGGAADVLAGAPPGRFDPAAAAALLQEAGYTRDDTGFWARGRRLTVPLIAPMPLEELATAVAGQLRAAGMAAPVEVAPDFAGRLAYGTASAWLAGGGSPPRHASAFDPTGTLRRFHVRYAAGADEPAAEPTRWGDPAFDVAVDRLENLALDDPAYLVAFREALAIWLDGLPEVPLIRRPLRLATNTTFWRDWPAAGPAPPVAPWRRDFVLALGALTPAPPPDVG